MHVGLLVPLMDPAAPASTIHAWRILGDLVRRPDCIYTLYITLTLFPLTDTHTHTLSLQYVTQFLHTHSSFRSVSTKPSHWDYSMWHWSSSFKCYGPLPVCNSDAAVSQNRKDSWLSVSDCHPVFSCLHSESILTRYHNTVVLKMWKCLPTQSCMKTLHSSSWIL